MAGGWVRKLAGWQAFRLSGWQGGKHSGCQIGRQVGRQAGTQAGTHTDRQTDQQNVSHGVERPTCSLRACAVGGVFIYPLVYWLGKVFLVFRPRKGLLFLLEVTELTASETKLFISRAG